MDSKRSLLRTAAIILILLLIWNGYTLGKRYAVADNREHQVNQQSDESVN